MTRAATMARNAAIRAKAASGKYGVVELMEEYGLARSTVHQIARYAWPLSMQRVKAVPQRPNIMGRLGMDFVERKLKR